MKLKAFITIGLLLAAGIFTGAGDCFALVEPSGGGSADVMEFFNCTFKTEAPEGCPAGKSPDSSGSEASSDCCSGFSDYDPVTAVRAVCCNFQLVAVKFTSAARMIALADPSYPIIKPPQNQI